MLGACPKQLITGSNEDLGFTRAPQLPFWGTRPENPHFEERAAPPPSRETNNRPNLRRPGWARPRPRRDSGEGHSVAVAGPEVAARPGPARPAPSPTRRTGWPGPGVARRGPGTHTRARGPARPPLFPPGSPRSPEAGARTPLSARGFPAAGSRQLPQARASPAPAARLLVR